MSKELEALKVRVWNKIKDISNCKFPLDSFFNDIENYEKEEDKMSLLTDIETIADTFMSIIEQKEKLEKFREICKENKVCIYDIVAYDDVEDYNYDMNKLFVINGEKYKPLAEDQFNLLKEMLK